MIIKTIACRVNGVFFILRCPSSAKIAGLPGLAPLTMPHIRQNVGDELSQSASRLQVNSMREQNRIHPQ